MIGWMIVVLLLCGLLWFTLDLFSIRQKDSDLVPNPTRCSAESVRRAWLQNVKQKSTCPAFSNRVVVKDGVLFAKDLVVNTELDCCYFGDKLTPVEHPLVCNALRQGVLSDQILNMGSCSGKNCIELTNAGNNTYRITRFGTSTDPAIGMSLLTLDSGCGGLSSFMVNGIECIVLSGTNVTAIPSAPDFVKAIVTAYNAKKHFYAVAVENG